MIRHWISLSHFLFVSIRFVIDWYYFKEKEYVILNTDIPTCVSKIFYADFDIHCYTIFCDCNFHYLILIMSCITSFNVLIILELAIIINVGTNILILCETSLNWISCHALFLLFFNYLNLFLLIFIYLILWCFIIFCYIDIKKNKIFSVMKTQNISLRFK